MAPVVYLHTRQRVAVEFHTAEGSSLIEIHSHLRSMFGEDAIDIACIRCWVHCFKISEKDIVDRPNSVSAKFLFDRRTVTRTKVVKLC
jgi:hypothetical protein